MRRVSFFVARGVVVVVFLFFPPVFLLSSSFSFPVFFSTSAFSCFLPFVLLSTLFFCICHQGVSESGVFRIAYLLIHPFKQEESKALTYTHYKDHTALKRKGIQSMNYQRTELARRNKHELSHTNGSSHKHFSTSNISQKCHKHESIEYYWRMILSIET